jgi:hypothetical protein
MAMEAGREVEAGGEVEAGRQAGSAGREGGRHLREPGDGGAAGDEALLDLEE